MVLTDKIKKIKSVQRLFDVYSERSEYQLADFSYPLEHKFNETYQFVNGNGELILSRTRRTLYAVEVPVHKTGDDKAEEGYIIYKYRDHSYQDRKTGNWEKPEKQDSEIVKVVIEDWQTTQKICEDLAKKWREETIKDLQEHKCDFIELIIE